MKDILLALAAALFITGCGDKAPASDEAFQLGKKELSMALCGNQDANCFSVHGGGAKVSERKTDDTYNASATFKNITGKEGKLDYQEGVVFFEIDSKTRAVYVKSIEAWSEDGSKSIKLCGRDYKFCKT